MGIAVSTLVGILLSLQGCSFSATQSFCNGTSCECLLEFNEMDAGMYIGVTPIEHAWRRIKFLNFQNISDKHMSSCCSAIKNLYALQLRGQSSTASDAKHEFSSECGDSPCPTLALAAGRGSAGASVNARFLSAARLDANLTAVGHWQGSISRTESHDGKVAPPTDMSQNFTDCRVDYKGLDAKVSLNDVVVADAQSTFIIGWTDTHHVAQPCCETLRPVIQAMFVDGKEVAETEKAAFCAACKNAYNTGVALAAYRWCA